MPRFRLRAVTGTGEFVEGELEAQDQAAVVAQLREQGHLPLAAEPLAAGTGHRSLQEWLRQPLFGSGRVRRAEVAIITRELATLLDAGLTVDQLLRLLVDLAESQAMWRLIVDLLSRVQGRCWRRSSPPISCRSEAPAEAACRDAPAVRGGL